MPTSFSAPRAAASLLTAALALTLLSGCDRRPPTPEASPNTSTTPSTTTTTPMSGTTPMDPATPAASAAALVPASGASQ